MRITTNIPGLRAMSSASAAEKRMEALSRKLSSGVKINSAKNDPTGLAIANMLQVQTSGTKVATQNSLNAMSVLQTADAGLNEVHSILQRMRELAVQASNETLTSTDRLKIQAEIDQYKVEIDSISDKTEYNGTKLLNGHAGLIGKSQDATVISMTENIDPGDYSIVVGAPATSAVRAFNFASVFPSAAAAGLITVNGIDFEITSEDTAEIAAGKFEEVFNAAGIKTTPAGSTIQTATGLISAYSGSNHNINVTSGSPTLLAMFGAQTAGTDASVTLGAGFSAEARAVVDGNRIRITDKNNMEMVVDINPAVSGKIDIKVSDRCLVFQTGTDKDINTEVRIGAVTAASLGVDRLSVATVGSASRAIAEMDAAISRCSQIRANIGASELRLELTSENLDTSNIALEKALSKVYDTDMAYDIAELSRNRITAQGAMAIMGQANQRPQQVLQLLR